MPRLCVLCGKCQSHSFSVFSFPSSIQKRNAWLKIILKASPNFINDKKLFAKNKLKNGVCELHFSLSEISNGKKRRLDKDSVPSLNIPTASSCNTILRKYETLLRTERSEESVSEASTPTFTGIDIASNQNICDENYSDPSFPDCTIEIEDKNSLKIYNCVVKDLSRENKGFCLCCGSHMYWKYLFSISKLKSSNAQESLLDGLAKVLDVPQERIIKFSKYICRKCLKVVEDLLELNTNFQALLVYLKRKVFFNINRDDLDEDDPDIDNDSKEDLEGLSRPLNYSNRNDSYKFPCIDCSEKFENINSFCNHLAIHERNASSAFKAKYNCLHCNQRFLTKSSLTVHIKLHQQQKKSCQTCDRFGVEKLDLDSTIRNMKEGEKIPEGNFCEKIFTQDGTKYKLLSKTNRHFTCELCFKLFTHHMYQKHKFSCQSGKNILCDKCGEKFANISKLNKHINTAHCNNTTIVCNICNEIFPTISFYNHHLATKHKKKLYSCNICGSQFSKQLLASPSRLNYEDTICYKCTDKNNEIPLLSSNINSSYKHLQESVTSNVLSDSTVAVHKVYSNKRYDESSRVLNILRPSDTFQHNNNLRTIEFPSASLKESEDMELSNEGILPFDDNVNTLEDQSVVHDAIELEEDVSLINVQMLDSIEAHEQSLNVNVETENEDTINIIDVLESDIVTSTTVLSNSSLFSERTIFDGELKEDVPNVSPSLSSSCNITDGNVIRIVEPLVPPHVKQSNLQHISVTLKPDKSNWAFTNSLEHMEHNNDSSINPIIHSLDTESSIHDVVPPVTREIDITLPSDDEETKIASLSDPLNDNENKLTDHDLSPFSVDFDGKGDVRYVMFFESPDDKG